MQIWTQLGSNYSKMEFLFSFLKATCMHVGGLCEVSLMHSGWAHSPSAPIAGRELCCPTGLGVLLCFLYFSSFLSSFEVCIVTSASPEILLRHVLLVNEFSALPSSPVSSSLPVLLFPCLR